MNKIFTKLVTAFGASVAVTENVRLEPLRTALITLGVSVVTVLSVEGVAWLKEFLEAKRAKHKAEKKEYEKKCEEADEITQIADSEKEDK